MEDTMTHWLVSRMQAQGDALAIVNDGRSSTYADLVQVAAEWSQHPAVCATPPGSVFSLEHGYSPSAAGMLLALLSHGHIVVPIGRVPADKETEYLQTASVEYRLRRSISGRFEVLRTPRKASHVLYTALREAQSPGLVLFSSGTTGRSKASILDFGKLVEKHASPRKARTTLGFLTLDHIGGINTLLHTLAHGGKLVSVSDRTPDRVCAALAEHQVEVLPTTPTFLNICLIAGAFQRYDLRSLKLITYGTEPMPPVTLSRLARLLPEVRMKQTYGLSDPCL